MNKIKYLRKDRVPYACFYMEFNVETKQNEFGWSLCNKEDQFIKKVAVIVAKQNINKLAPHSIQSEMKNFVEWVKVKKINDVS